MNFYWFNGFVFRDYLRAKYKNDRISEHDLGSAEYKKLHAINRCFSRDPWGLQHDISGHVPHPFAIKTKTPYQFFYDYRKFGDICINTGKKIASMTDRTIAVLWSGGIDSTAALVALMQTVEPDRLVICCNDHSVREFPSFYDHKIKNLFRVIQPDNLHQNSGDFFSVSGDGGDTVWGVIDDSFWTTSHDKFHMPWQDCVDRDQINDIDFMSEFCSWSGVEINTWLQLRTWYYLCCKWQDKCMRPYALGNGFTDKDAVAFYDVDASFQTWTMNNLDKIIGNRWQDYKMPAKQFIYQYHDDRDYLQHKTKEDSKFLNPDLTTVSKLKSHFRIAVTENFLDIRLPSWPFIDYKEIEDFNDEYHLIPKHFLQ